MKSWGEQSANTNIILSYWGININSLSTNGWSIMVEPIFTVKLGGERLSLTPTEIAVIGARDLGADTIPPSSKNSGSIAFISNNTNRDFPSSLRLEKTCLGMDAVSQLSNRISYADIIIIRNKIRKI